MGCCKSKQHPLINESYEQKSAEDMLKELSKQYEHSIKAESDSFQLLTKSQDKQNIFTDNEQENKSHLQNDDFMIENDSEDIDVEVVKFNKPLKSSEDAIEKKRPDPPTRKPPEITSHLKQSKNILSEYSDPDLNISSVTLNSEYDQEHETNHTEQKLKDEENDQNVENCNLNESNLQKKDSFTLYKTSESLKGSKNKKIKRKKVCFTTEEPIIIPRNENDADFSENDDDDFDFEDEEFDQNLRQAEVRKMIKKRKSMAAVKIGKVEMLRRKFEANCQASAVTLS